MIAITINSANSLQLSRRSFLRVCAAAAGGLLVSLYLDLPLVAQEGGQPKPQVYPPDAFVHIKPDGTILITVNRLEFGQGVQTSLPMILADELDADWSQVKAELAPAADVYKDPLFGIQFVGGSNSIAHSFEQYRELGARTRAMLVAAAAEEWKVSPSQCHTEASVVYGPGGKSATYGKLAEAATHQSIPATVQLKDRSQFRLVGKRVPRLDSRPKCNGSLKFGLDLDIPGMKTAVVAHPPVFGGRVKSLDDKTARGVEGVRDVFEIPLVRGTGVAVVADKFWIAKQARDRLKVTFRRSRACFAIQNLSATTATPVPLTRGISNTSRTPSTPRAVLSSKLLTRPPNTGGCATTAVFMPGMSRSSPNLSEPLHLGRLSSRGTLFPTRRNCDRSFSWTVAGIDW